MSDRTLSQKVPALIGHGRVVSMLDLFACDIRAGREHVPHALLFSGPASLGKYTTAVRFFQQVYCSEEKATPCGTCRTCTLIPKGAFPDVMVFPREGKLTIDAIRTLQERFSRSAVEGSWKLALLPQADRLTPEAANALLKTLEEPAPHSLLLVTASSPDVLLPTIVSRCAVFPFRRVSDDQLRAGLLRRAASADTLDLVCALADGRPGRAISFLEDDISREQLLEEARTLAKTDSQSFAERFQRAKELADEDREALDALLDTWIGLLRLALLARVGAVPPLPFELEQVFGDDFLLQPEDRFVGLVQRALEVREGLRENANVRLSLESFLLAF